MTKQEIGMASNYDVPGIGGQVFSISFDERWNKTGDILTVKDQKLRVLKDASIKRGQWYWRVLHYLTLKKYFGKLYIYPVELVVEEKK